MLYVHKAPDARGGWAWRIGQVALAYAYVTAQTEPGLFSFVISGVHRQGAELFSTHARAEALLQRHLGCAASFGEQAGEQQQQVTVARADRWVKLRHDDPPEQEQDSYTYTIGNVVLASLENLKSIRLSGYRFYLSSRPAAAPGAKAPSVSAGEQQLIAALGCAVEIRRCGVSYACGPNHLPCAADGFAAQPTLYDGRPAW